MTSTPRGPQHHDQWGAPGPGETPAQPWGQPGTGGQPWPGAPVQHGPQGWSEHGQWQDAPTGAAVWQAPTGQGAPEPWQSTYGPADTLRPGQPWQRLGARLIDGLIQSALALVLLLPPFIWLGASSGPNPDAASGGQILAVLLLFFLMGVGVPALQLGFVSYYGGLKGATPGKRALGLRVISVRTGQPIGFWRYVGRELIFGLAGSIIVGFFSIWFDGTGQLRGWHDVAVDSRVIEG